MTPMRELRGVDAAIFRDEVCALYEPVVMRGVVAEWPAVKAALESPALFCTYLARRDAKSPVDTLRTPPSAKGRIFYNDAMNGFNYDHEKATVTQVIERIVKYAALANPPAVAAQSALLEDCAPDVAKENTMPLLHPSVRPRLWLGSAVVTPAHFDESGNVACVAAGRRRFTLFPPEQVANLYIGPLDFAPTGTPISLVDFRLPEDPRFPRFKLALENARVAELSPGDAIYIPPLWWHHVESLEPLNALVNYWWDGDPAAPSPKASAIEALHQGVRTFGKMPAAQRAAWRAIYGNFVFDRD